LIGQNKASRKIVSTSSKRLKESKNQLNMPKAFI
jgi:hypothetical protein